MMTTDNSAPSLLIFGATGGTGIALVRHALARGYSVSALVRNPEAAALKLGDSAVDVRLVAGDALDADAVEAAFAEPPTAVISALGIYQGKAGVTTLTDATAHIVASMRKSGVSRILCISSLGVGDSYQQGNFVARLVQRTTLKHTIADKEQQEQLLRESGLDWTSVRPSRLVEDSGPQGYRAWQGPQPQGKLKWAIRRSVVADFTLDCLNDPDSIGKAFTITGDKT